MYTTISIVLTRSQSDLKFRCGVITLHWNNQAFWLDFASLVTSLGKPIILRHFSVELLLYSVICVGTALVPTDSPQIYQPKIAVNLSVIKVRIMLNNSTDSTGYAANTLHRDHREGRLHQHPCFKVSCSGKGGPHEDELFEQRDLQVKPELRHARPELCQLVSSTSELPSRICPEHFRVKQMRIRAGTNKFFYHYWQYQWHQIWGSLATLAK